MRAALFTGIVENLATVQSVDATQAGFRLKIDIGKTYDDVGIGDSISISGCCLTVVEMNQTFLMFDAGQETWSRTTMRKLVTGSQVNVERAIKVGDRLGGHYVTGHIDGLGTLTSRSDDADWSNLTFETSANLMKQMASKGSITIDGVSLTLVNVNDSSFSVALIPHTLAITTLGSLQTGDTVNLETDVLAKYVERQLLWKMD